MLWNREGRVGGSTIYVDGFGRQGGAATGLSEMGFVIERAFVVFVLSLVVLIRSCTAEEGRQIPTTLDGPFKPYTKIFDSSLRSGSDDLPLYDPRVVKRVAAIYPEQINLALSTPDAMWVSWVSGKLRSCLHSLP